MAKHSAIEYSSTAASNTDAGGVSVAEGTAPSNINDAIREIMSHMKNMVDDQGGSLDLGGTADVATVTLNQSFTSLTDGFYFVAKCTGDNTTVVTLNVNSKGAKKVQKNVDGTETALAAGDMQSGSHYGFIYDTAIDSSNGGWWLVDLNHTSSSSLSNVVEDTTPQLGGNLDTNSKSVQESKGADVASAAELLVLTDGNYFDVTGTTTITSIEHTADAWKVGSEITLQFDGALTLTHHATNLILPGGANITTAAGDTAVFKKVAAGDWKCIQYTVAADAPGGGGGVWVLVSSSSPSAASTVDFTGLDSTYFIYRVEFECWPGNSWPFYFRTSTDGGSTFDSGTNAYYIDSDGFTQVNLSDAKNVEGDTAAATEGCAGYVVIVNPSNTTGTKLYGRTVFHEQGGGADPTIYDWGGQRDSGADVDAIRFYSGGNTITGEFRLYGLKGA